MSYASRISRKIGDRMNPLLAESRRAKLARTDFTIISNNCWAGSVYRRYGLPYGSPTAGLYFFADDYVRFASRLRRYTSVPLEFIDTRESRHAEQLAAKGELSKIVARLDDIEVVLLRYPTLEEAREKWERRCSRINWDNLFIKFSQMNGCTYEDLAAFDAIPFRNKICFTASPRPELSCAVHFPGFDERGGCSMTRTTTRGTSTWRSGSIASLSGTVWGEERPAVLKGPLP